VVPLPCVLCDEFEQLEQPKCGWKSGWYETSVEAGRRHSPNCRLPTGTSSKVVDPSNKHVVGVERLAQNAQTSFGIDVRAEASADAAGSSRLQSQEETGFPLAVDRRGPNNHHSTRSENTT
jgi:hypothetical protein